MSFDIQGHRGARGLLPENSIPGFRRALELGVDTLELDVVISRDEKVVVSHDPVFSSQICRLPDGTQVTPSLERRLALFGMDYDDIRRYDCGTVAQDRFPRQQLRAVRKPLLSEVFNMAEEFARRYRRPAAHYNIETKSSEAGDGRLHPGPRRFVELLIEEIRSARLEERTTIQSFDPRTLREARRTAPDIALSLLIDYDGGSLTDRVEELGFLPRFVSPDYRLVNADFVATANERGMKVLPWTVNAPGDMKRMASFGVCGIITDYPDVAIALFSEPRVPPKQTSKSG